MLHEFLNVNRSDLIRRCQAKVARRPEPRPTWDEMKFGIPIFLAQFHTLNRLLDNAIAAAVTEYRSKPSNVTLR